MNASASPTSIPDDLLSTLIARAAEMEASDLHLLSHHPPFVRRHGTIEQMDHTPLSEQTLTLAIRQRLDDAQLQHLTEHRQIDCSWEIPVGAHAISCRVNVFHALDALGIAIRILPTHVPDLEWAGLPHKTVRQVLGLRDGLVICTGPTGSGKTTTLAILVNTLHQQGGKRIISIEEPIEYRFPPQPQSLISQREVGSDVPTFEEGLRAGLRQDPDIILVGEIRDQESARMALGAAETGHLVFTSLHTRDSKGAISRLIDLFPESAQQDVRSQLSWALRAVLAHRLLPSANPYEKRKLALEVLLNIDPIPSAIRNFKLDSIPNYLMTKASEGLQSFDESISQLCGSGAISKEVAESHVSDPEYLYRRIRQQSYGNE